MKILLVFNLICLSKLCRAGFVDEIKDKLTGTKESTPGIKSNTPIQDLPLQQGERPGIAPPGPPTPSSIGSADFYSEAPGEEEIRTSNADKVWDMCNGDSYPSHHLRSSCRSQERYRENSGAQDDLVVVHSETTYAY